MASVMTSIRNLMASRAADLFDRFTTSFSMGLSAESLASKMSLYLSLRRSLDQFNQDSELAECTNLEVNIRF